MNVEGVSPPTPFLARPGKPALPWSDWIFSFHNYLTALGGEAYSTERKTALLLHCVGAEAQRVYRTLPVQPRREDEDEFHAAERQLAEFYEPQVNVIAERFFFRQRRQESHEPTADYVAALRRLAVNCSFGQMTDAMIRDQVVEATVHPILRERFLQDKGLTLDRVLEIAEAFERSRREATAMAGPARPAADGAQSLHQISDARQRRGRRPWRPARRQDDRRPAPAQLQADRRPGPAQLQPDTCPSCGRRQHNERGRCPATGATCRQCGRTGHFAVVCWSGERNDDRRCHELTVLCCAVPNTDKMMCEVQMKVPGITQTVNLQVDTGATVSALGLGIARRLFKGSRLNRTSARLFGFGRHQLQVLGTLPALVTYRGRRANTEFFIIDSDGEEAVMGLDLLKQLDVNLHPASGAIDQLAVTGSAEVPEPPPSQPDPGEICSLTMVRGHPEEADLHEDSSAEEEVIALLTDEESVLTEQDVRTASAADPELQQLRHQIKRGWPSSAKACPVEVQPYFKMRHELWVRNDDVILRGAQQVVVPVQLRRRYLELAHSAHDGIVRMKQALRNLAWWPGINREVEELCRSCERCQHSDAVLSQRARPAPMQPVDLPDRAWSKLGMDIVGPINGAPATARYAITLIDYRSKWAEVCLTSSTETEDVIKFLSTVWAKEGYPDEIVTDNGPQFTSREFTAYLAARGVKHTKSSVYWPRGNSAVERFNKTFKSWITDCPPAAFIDEVRKSLAVYRATPHTTTGKSPSELLHGRQMRLNLPVIQPSTPGADSVASRVRRRQQSNKRSYDRRRGVTTPRITEGDYVCVRRQGHRSKTSCRFTSPVRVTGRVGPATYRLADGRTWNAAHLARLPYAPASPSASPPAGPGETTSTATTSEADAAGPLTSLAAASRPSTETACEPSPDAADVSVQRPRRSDRVCRRPDYYVSQ
ncbi:uncharacterized protein FJT64_004334 [Amphibalanus amphitrite]|uniref:RNA-directed DNA polymerase n=1 Tax=Amphibalanus amphitrite TaxID=1232801 RepID=A0A6A4W8S8_AMPAM|nr:uncharacterized protein FJT64_004334 [Amphibalanus amphitrite]